MTTHRFVILNGAGKVDPTTIPTATTSAVGGVQLPGGTTTYLRADGTFATPSTSSPAASETVSGIVELATTTETTTGTDTTRAVTPAGVKAVADTKSNTGHTHAQSDITNLTTDLSAKAPLASPVFTGTVRIPPTTNGIVTASGSNGTVGVTATPGTTTTFLRGDGTFASLPAATETASGIIELATTSEASTGTDTSRAVTPAGLKAVADTKSATGHTHAQSEVTNLTTDLAAKAPLASPIFTGTVRLPTTTNGLVQTTGGNGAAGVIALPGGTTTFLRGDGTFGTPPSSPAASETVAGDIEIATTAETITGTDAVRAVTPAALRAAIIVGAPATVPLTDAATIATNASLGDTFSVTIAGNRTLGAPTNPTDGQRLMWIVTASGADRTLTLATGATGAFKFGTDITTVPTIVSGTITYIGAIYHSTAQRWHVLAVASGY